MATAREPPEKENDLDDEMAKRFDKYLRTYHFLKREINDCKRPMNPDDDNHLPVSSDTSKNKNPYASTDSSVIVKGVFYIRTVGFNVAAKLLSNGKVIILKGSILRKEMTPTFERKEFRKKLLTPYSTLTDDGYYVNEDLPPMSPNGASGLV